MGENLLAVIIGGLIAIVSGAVAPTVQHFLGKRARDDEARRLNQVALITEVHELERWADSLQQHYLFGGDNPLTISPMAKVEAMVLTHFPEGKLPLAELQARLAAHKVWMVQRGKERLQGIPIKIDDYETTYQPFSLAQANLIRAVTGQPPLVLE